MANIFANGEELVTLKELYSLLGISNLLTDDEMNIANALMSDAAKKAISNINYSNGVNAFHYYGGPDYERINWKFEVKPNTNYRVVIDAKSSANLTPIDSNNKFIPWNINSTQDLTEALNGDIATWHLPLSWQGIQHGEITFNSGNHNEVFLTTNFGMANDGINSDITLQIKMFKADSIQDQIDQINSKLSSK